MRPKPIAVDPHCLPATESSISAMFSRHDACPRSGMLEKQKEAKAKIQLRFTKDGARMKLKRHHDTMRDYVG